VVNVAQGRPTRTTPARAVLPEHLASNTRPVVAAEERILRSLRPSLSSVRTRLRAEACGVVLELRGADLERVSAGCAHAFDEHGTQASVPSAKVEHRKPRANGENRSPEKRRHLVGRSASGERPEPLVLGRGVPRELARAHRHETRDREHILF
jgi:hypothetical protein